ncbi:MAG: hypothetical protein DI587_36405 [Variovorax paradoxus]|nr:MAG: hypothetical protein DI583_36405 [Variovorax paradoxus]PZQ00788.1 MAG: hypothetical protein DI587_36405 [Variovorax paradoxus]
MVPKLNIDRVQPGLYRVDIEGNGMTMTEPEMVSTLAEGLKFAGDDVPREWALYVEVHYNGVCLGTRPLQQLAETPEEVARELVELVAQVSEAERGLPVMLGRA